MDSKNEWHAGLNPPRPCHEATVLATDPPPQLESNGDLCLKNDASLP